MRYWKRVDTNDLTTTVESYSHDHDIDGAIEIDQAEFNAYIASLPPPTLDPDYARATELLSNPPEAITTPEIWELLRIIGRLFGWC